jgi:hypothetical protein
MLQYTYSYTDYVCRHPKFPLAVCCSIVLIPSHGIFDTEEIQAPRLPTRLECWTFLDRFKLDDQTNTPHHVPCAAHPPEIQSGLDQGKTARKPAGASS